MKTLISDLEPMSQASGSSASTSSQCVLNDSPYAATPSDICELSVSAAVGTQSLKRCVERLRGIHIVIPNSSGYIYYVGNKEDTILTDCDIQYWKIHPLMHGDICIIGTFGNRRTLTWDRQVVATNAVGHVYIYTMHDQTFITKIADSLTELLTTGLCKQYMKMQKELREGKTPTITGICISPANHPFWSSPDCAKWLPFEVNGVRCARVPSEKIRRGIYLQTEDFPDVMFKSSCSAHCQ